MVSARLVGRPRDRVQRICVACGNSFEVPRSRRNQIHCSFSCRRGVDVARNCEWCRRSFTLTPRMQRDGTRFCSKRCASLSHKSRPDLAPTVHPTMFDIVFAAGVYQGEGTCQGPPRQRSEIVKVGQVETWLLTWLRDRFGGSVKIYGEARRRDGGVRRSFGYWLLTGPRARGFLYTIFTFLSPRRRAQLKEVLAA